MKLSEFYAVADAIAPKALSDAYCAAYSAYDNSGVLVNTGDDVKKALFSLDLSTAAIDQAIQAGANLIVTHHPAIYGGIHRIDCEAFAPLGEKLVRCMKAGISVISMHLNLDCAEGGIDESLQEGVSKAAGGQKVCAEIMQPLEKGGYGRVYDIQEITLGDLKKSLENEFSTLRIVSYGDEKKIIHRAASFCGSGADEKAVQFAHQKGAQVMLSADFKHHVLTLANEKGLAVIAMTHYASENYGFEKYYQKIRQSVNVPCVYHTDNQLL